MKIKVTMNDPDTLSDAIRYAVENSVRKMGIDGDEERLAVTVARRTKIAHIASQWFDEGEYLTVEIDTEAQTCVVLEN